MIHSVIVFNVFAPLVIAKLTRLRLSLELPRYPIGLSLEISLEDHGFFPP